MNGCKCYTLILVFWFSWQRTPFVAISTHVCFRNSDVSTDYTVGAKRNVDGIDCYSIPRNICANLEVSLTAL